MTTFLHSNFAGTQVQSQGVEGRHIEEQSVGTGGPVMVDAGWAAAEGDSGGVVFALTSNGTTQARGQVSSGLDGISGGGFNAVCWTEAPDILNHYGLKLNPNT